MDRKYGWIHDMNDVYCMHTDPTMHTDQYVVIL